MPRPTERQRDSYRGYACLVWFLEANQRLSQAAKIAFLDTTSRVVIPTIVLAEVSFLRARGRFTLDTSTVLAHIASVPNWVIYDLDETVVRHLPTTLDIHDAIIVATALVFRDVLGENTAVVSKDAQIAASQLIPVIW